MNRKQKIKCVVGILQWENLLQYQPFTCSLLHFQSSEGWEVFSWISCGPRFWGLSLAPGVTRLECQSCAVFPALPGPVSALYLPQLGVLLPHFSLISSSPQYPFYPSAFAGLSTPFLQGLLCFPLSSLPLQNLIVVWRPQLIPLSIVLIPQIWLVCPTSVFKLPLPHVLDVCRMPGTTLSAGDLRMRESEPCLWRDHHLTGSEVSRVVEHKWRQCNMICARKVVGTSDMRT